MNKEHILVVEDDLDINNLIAKTLKKKEYQLTQAFSGSEALLRLSMDEKFDIILLDLMLPGATGEELIEVIRKEKEIPIIVISAKTALEDKVNILNIGADDYITKPFESEEVLARINSQLRRYKKFERTSNDNKQYKFKGLSLYEESREVKVNGEELYLTAHEFDILNILFKNPDKVYSREILYEKIWKNGYYGEDNTVNVHVSNIRKKIKT